VQPSPFHSPSKSKRQGRKSPKKKNQKSPTKAATEPKPNQATPTKNGNKRGVKQDTPEHTKEADRHAKKLTEKKAGNTAMDTNVDTFGPPQVERQPKQPPPDTATPGYTRWKHQIESQDKPTDKANNQVSPDQVQVTWEQPALSRIAHKRSTQQRTNSCKQLLWICQRMRILRVKMET
jgi:hypothetical protein